MATGQSGGITRRRKKPKTLEMGQDIVSSHPLPRLGETSSHSKKTGGLSTATTERLIAIRLANTKTIFGLCGCSGSVSKSKL